MAMEGSSTIISGPTRVTWPHLMFVPRTARSSAPINAAMTRRSLDGADEWRIYRPSSITQAKAVTMPSDPLTLLLTVTVMPGRRRTDVVLSGEVDLAARPVLDAAVDRLAEAAPDTTVIDLAAVVFGGSVLASFLASVRAAIPAGSQLMLARPKPLIHRVLQLTGMDQIGVISDK
jgi:anti-anti-sigma factor